MTGGAVAIFVSGFASAQVWAGTTTELERSTAPSVSATFPTTSSTSTTLPAPQPQRAVAPGDACTLSAPVSDVSDDADDAVCVRRALTLVGLDVEGLGLTQAVERYQETFELDVTGIVDQPTAASLGLEWAPSTATTASSTAAPSTSTIVTTTTTTPSSTAASTAAAPTSSATPASTAASSTTATSATTASQAPIPAGNRLRIPAIGMDREVVTGGQPEIDAGNVVLCTNCGRSVGWPGSGQTVWIAAHRSSHGASFAKVPDLSVGDVIEVVHDGISRSYTVTGSQAVDRLHPPAGAISGPLVLQTSLGGDQVLLVYAS